MDDDSRDTTNEGGIGIAGCQQPDATAELMHEAEAGDGAAACRLGDRYRTGETLPDNPRKAWRWYLCGAWAGDGYAMNNLGACYHNGYGCKRNMTRALHWSVHLLSNAQRRWMF